MTGEKDATRKRAALLWALQHTTWMFDKETRTRTWKAFRPRFGSLRTSFFQQSMFHFLIYTKGTSKSHEFFRGFEPSWAIPPGILQGNPSGFVTFRRLRNHKALSTAWCLMFQKCFAQKGNHQKHIFEQYPLICLGIPKLTRRIKSYQINMRNSHELQKHHSIRATSRAVPCIFSISFYHVPLRFLSK